MIDWLMTILLIPDHYYMNYRNKSLTMIRIQNKRVEHLKSVDPNQSLSRDSSKSLHTCPYCRCDSPLPERTQNNKGELGSIYTRNLDVSKRVQLPMRAACIKTPRKKHKVKVKGISLSMSKVRSQVQLISPRNFPLTGNTFSKPLSPVGSKMKYNVGFRINQRVSFRYGSPEKKFIPNIYSQDNIKKLTERIFSTKQYNQFKTQQKEEIQAFRTHFAVPKAHPTNQIKSLYYNESKLGDGALESVMPVKHRVISGTYKFKKSQASDRNTQTQTLIAKKSSLQLDRIQPPSLTPQIPGKEQKLCEQMIDPRQITTLRQITFSKLFDKKIKMNRHVKGKVQKAQITQLQSNIDSVNTPSDQQATQMLSMEDAPKEIFKHYDSLQKQEDAVDESPSQIPNQAQKQHLLSDKIFTKILSEKKTTNMGVCSTIRRSLPFKQTSKSIEVQKDQKTSYSQFAPNQIEEDDPSSHSNQAIITIDRIEHNTSMMDQKGMEREIDQQNRPIFYKKRINQRDQLTVMSEWDNNTDQQEYNTRTMGRKKINPSILKNLIRHDRQSAQVHRLLEQQVELRYDYYDGRSSSSLSSRANL